MNGKKTKPTPIDEALEAYFARSGMKKRLAQATVVGDWEKLVGTNIARVTTPQRVTADGVLHVAVQSSAWMQELQLMSPTILRQLHQQGKRIKRIAWRAG